MKLARMSVIGVVVCLGAAATALWAEGPKKVSRSEAIAAATAKPQPAYPENARQLRMQGDVEVEAVIGENGVVENVTPVAGNPVLTRAAMDAVRRWKFTPFTDGGKAVKASAVLLFSFKL
jgi:protein TonB